MRYITKRAKSLIVISTIVGSIIEWYDVFIFIYWAPVLARYFFESKSLLTGTIYAFVLNLIGFLARPIGSLIFGPIGDIYGRKTAFFWSIFCISVPSFLIGFIPSYSEIGMFSPILLVFTRILQGLPAGGEIPTAFSLKRFDSFC